MNRLFFANLSRLRKNKMFWLGMVVTAGIGILQSYSTYDAKLEYAELYSEEYYYLDDFVFFPLLIIGIVLAVVVSLFVGTDYSDGTIRNKIMIGRSRESIYGANFAICAVTGIIIYVLGIGVNIAVGMPLLGGLHIKAAAAVGFFVVGLLAVVVYAALFNLIAMLSSSKVYGAVISILVAFGLLFLTAQIYNDLVQPKMIEQVNVVKDQLVTETVANPHYISGLKREVYLLLMDILPSGQGTQVMNLDVQHPYYLVGYSVMLIVAFNLIGGMLFKKKNLM